MSRFLDRYLPRSERRSALWLALGGAATTTIALRVGGAVRDAVPVGADVGGVPPWGSDVIAAMTEFAVIALLVAALIRFARAPKALALYLVLGAALGIALQIVGLPFDYLDAKIGWVVEGVRVSDGTAGWWISSVRAGLVDLAIGLGALAGAWIAATVSLARIRDAGFSGDAPNGRGLRTSPDHIGWSFIGWEGRPVGGDSLVAVAFLAARMFMGILGIALGGVLLLIPSRVDGGAVAYATGVFYMAVLAVGWLFAARLVTKRTAVVCVWLLPLSGLLSSAWFVLDNFMSMGPPTVSDAALAVGQNLTPPVIAAVAALAGTELALRREPATLSEDAPQDPAAPDAPPDTAGDSDE